METVTIDVPAMYGDHHVLEVRRLLLEIPGVEEVYASSCFRIVEVTYDPQRVTPEQIRARLEEMGYTDELAVPTEIMALSYQGNGKKGFLRHSQVYENTRQVVSFAQNVPYSGRPLWPCPGMGLIRKDDLKEE